MRKKIRIVGKTKIKSRPKEPSYIEKLFIKQFYSAGIEFSPFIDEYEIRSEYRYNTNRKFRLDFALPNLKIGIELEGGIWHKGGHSSGHGITRDCIKYNDLQRLGWKVFRFTSEQVKSKYAINWLINYFISQNDYYRLFLSDQEYMIEKLNDEFVKGILPGVELRSGFKENIGFDKINEDVKITVLMSRGIQEDLFPELTPKTDDKKLP